MDVRKFGYIRVSSKDKNEGRQLQTMLENGPDERYFYRRNSSKISLCSLCEDGIWPDKRIQLPFKEA
ncbi:hypothetical protein QNH33_14655 [Peribacillus frigoritolerans]|nr:hypothetical protein [Peribacillus frigoritolerans]WHX59891.1 hypothetical protein QNH33_14655 [Peribacillus frigoritolerans]